MTMVNTRVGSPAYRYVCRRTAAPSARSGGGAQPRPRGLLPRATERSRTLPPCASPYAISSCVFPAGSVSTSVPSSCRGRWAPAPSNPSSLFAGRPCFHRPAAERSAARSLARPLATRSHRQGSAPRRAFQRPVRSVAVPRMRNRATGSSQARSESTRRFAACRNRFAKLERRWPIGSNCLD
jgi:hypothetical protein